jgi:hypothetical protein
MIPQRTFQICCVLFMLGVASGQSGTQASEPFGDVFKPIQADFEVGVQNLPRDTDQRDEPQYDITAVNRLLVHTRANTVAQIPDSAVPLRSYVERRFPSPVPTDGSASSGMVQQALDSGKALLAMLRRLPNVRLILAINSTPSGATFELIAADGAHKVVSTNDRINIYRGEYDYVVKMHGYKEVHGSINFIEEPGDVFNCDLRSNDQREEAVLCHLR